jgi:hypothetical protein
MSKVSQLIDHHSCETLYKGEKGFTFGTVLNYHAFDAVGLPKNG